MESKTDDGVKTRSFDFGGQAVEVAYFPAMWRVKAGQSVAESRHLDEALESVLKGVSGVAFTPTMLVKLTVEVLSWAADGAKAA